MDLIQSHELAHLTVDIASLAIKQPQRALVLEIQEVLNYTGKKGGQESAFYDALLPQQEDSRLREAFYTFFTSLSSNAPLLIALDDIQWADDSSSDMLGYLTRRMADHPIVILTTCRETELNAHRVLSPLIASMQREQVGELLHIQPLSDEHIGALISDLPTPAIAQIQN